MALLPTKLQKMALIVRTDLGMSQGKIAAQCSHATLECYLKGSQGLLNYFSVKAWYIMGQPKIVLRVQNEKDLMLLANQAEKAGVTTVAIKDAGKTQLKPGTVTVLGIGPASALRIDSIVSHLKLL